MLGLGSTVIVAVTTTQSDKSTQQPMVLERPQTRHYKTARILSTPFPGNLLRFQHCLLIRQSTYSNINIGIIEIFISGMKRIPYLFRFSKLICFANFCIYIRRRNGFHAHVIAAAWRHVGFINAWTAIDIGIVEYPVIFFRLPPVMSRSSGAPKGNNRNMETPRYMQQSGIIGNHQSRITNQFQGGAE